MSNVVFHIGFPKTGTTTLQECFLSLASVHYLGKMLRDNPRRMRGDARVEQSRRLADALLTADTNRFVEAAPSLSKTLADYVADGKPVLLSDEALTFGEYMHIATRSSTPIVSDHVRMAGRLRRLWPDAHILVGIREQKSLLRSFYLQRLETGMKFQTFDRYIERALATAGQRSILNALRYDEMFKAYSDAFGTARIKVLPFETYRARFSILMGAAAEALGIPAAETLAAWNGLHVNERTRSYAHARFFHKALGGVFARLPAPFYRRLKTMFALVPDRVDMSEAHVHALDAFFAPVNARLERITGIDLSGLRYSVGTP